jgi:hypothetical protein
VDSARLPHGAQMWRLSAAGETVVALLDADGPRWVSTSADAPASPATPVSPANPALSPDGSAEPAGPTGAEAGGQP